MTSFRVIERQHHSPTCRQRLLIPQHLPTKTTRLGMGHWIIVHYPRGLRAVWLKDHILSRVARSSSFFVVEETGIVMIVQIRRNQWFGRTESLWLIVALNMMSLGSNLCGDWALLSWDVDGLFHPPSTETCPCLIVPYCIQWFSLLSLSRAWFVREAKTSENVWYTLIYILIIIEVILFSHKY
jgi:hypothetical protein